VGIDLFEAPRRPEDSSGVGSLEATWRNIQDCLSTGGGFAYIQLHVHSACLRRPAPCRRSGAAMALRVCYSTSDWVSNALCVMW
jgi:hypothetical protein